MSCTSFENSTFLWRLLNVYLNLILVENISPLCILGNLTIYCGQLLGWLLNTGYPPHNPTDNLEQMMVRNGQKQRQWGKQWPWKWETVGCPWHVSHTNAEKRASWSAICIQAIFSQTSIWQTRQLWIIMIQILNHIFTKYWMTSWVLILIVTFLKKRRFFFWKPYTDKGETILLFLGRVHSFWNYGQNSTQVGENEVR